MPKNKGKYKSQQPVATAVEPTEVVRDIWSRMGAVVAPHRFKILAAVGLVVVLLVSMTAWSWWDARREQNATRGFQAALTAQSGRLVEATDAELPPMPGEDAEAPKFKSAEERSTATLAALEKVEKDYGGTDVAKHTRLVKAGVLYDLGRYDDAAAIYRASLSSSGALKLVAREGLALSLEAKALAQKDSTARTSGLDAALAEYKQLQPDEKGYYRDVAVYHQARVLQLKGDKPGAVILYKQIVENMPSSSIVGQARERLALLEE